jgi:hypothetical protein
MLVMLLIVVISQERAMSPRVQSEPMSRRIHAATASLEDSRWIWTEVLTSVALTGMCVAALFSGI